MNPQDLTRTYTVSLTKEIGEITVADLQSFLNEVPRPDGDDTKVWIYSSMTNIVLSVQSRREGPGQ